MNHENKYNKCLKGFVKGSIYSLKNVNFPGATINEKILKIDNNRKCDIENFDSSDLISGEVFISINKKTLDLIDNLEGFDSSQPNSKNLYTRVLTYVYLKDSNICIPAWTYELENLDNYKNKKLFQKWEG